MQNPDKGTQYIEDGFEFDDFNKRTIRENQKNARIRKSLDGINLLTVIIAFLFIFAFLFIYFAFDYFTHSETNNLINDKARTIVTAETNGALAKDEDAAEVMGVGLGAANEPALPIESEPTRKLEAETGEPVIEQAKPVLDKIAKLRESFSNDEIVGYLNIDGTNISYAVAQTTDNDFYLVHDLYGEKNAAGSIFMDYESDPDRFSRNTVIYGHNMRNGTMFHNIRYYNDRNYYEERRFISLTTLYKETTWEIFAFYKTETDFNYIQVVFPDDQSFESLLSEMKHKSIYDTEVEVGAKDRILTLSTCVDTVGDERYVLNAKLIE